ncbi:MAG: hypothetical protein ACI31M_00735 [Bacilli bacterium]
MKRIIFLILGIILSSIGLMFIVLYLNLLTIGYNFKDYVKFIISKMECILFLIGIIIIIVSLEGRKIIENINRHRRKF